MNKKLDRLWRKFKSGMESCLMVLLMLFFITVPFLLYGSFVVGVGIVLLYAYKQIVLGQ